MYAIVVIGGVIESIYFFFLSGGDWGEMSTTSDDRRVRKIPETVVSVYSLINQKDTVRFSSILVVTSRDIEVWLNGRLIDKLGFVSGVISTH